MNHFGEGSRRDFVAKLFVFAVTLDEEDRQDSSETSSEGCCQLKKEKKAGPSDLVTCLILQLQGDLLAEARVAAWP